MRRLVLPLAAALVPLLPAAPAYAATNTICVGSPAGTCDIVAMSISAAIDLADVNGVADTILVGPGTYTDGPYALDGSTHGLTLQGSGEGTTVLEPLAAGQQNMVNLNGASIRDLTVSMVTTTSDGDRGMSLYNGASATSVTVAGLGTVNTTGATVVDSTLTDVSIHLDADTSPSTRGIFSEGGSALTDVTVTASTGVNVSGPGATDAYTRLSITARDNGIEVDGGTVNVDNTLIELTNDSGYGLAAANFNPGEADKIINADHVTIVGGGSGSTGAYASAAAPTARQLSEVNLTNSVIAGPERSLVVEASNDGLQGGDSSAFIDVSYSDFDPADQVETIGTNGVGDIVSGAGNVNVPPGFLNAVAGNYRLAASSALLDAGDPAPGGPTLDLDGLARVVDGDGDDTAVRDMGAYERGDNVPPETTITSGPSGPTSAVSPSFAFSSEPGVTFECMIDAGAYAACSSPFTSAPLADGPHTFSVRATDPSANVEPTPATRSFTVDTAAPQTTFTKTPAKKVFSRKVKFRFTSNEAGVTFQCQRDVKAWKPCTSPYRWRVKLGKHVLQVRAVDAAGNVDATPARYRFKRLPKP